MVFGHLLWMFVCFRLTGRKLAVTSPRLTLACPHFRIQIILSSPQS